MTHWLNPLRRPNGTGATTSLQREMNRLFDSFFEDWGLPATSAAEAWVPALDVEETDDAFLVTAELPGIDPKDVQITAAGNELTIRGDVSFKTEKKERTLHRRERRQGTFFRSIALPSNVNSDQVKAVYRNGLLELTLPKKEEARPRTIKVEMA